MVLKKILISPRVAVPHWLPQNNTSCGLKGNNDMAAKVNNLSIKCVKMTVIQFF